MISWIGEDLYHAHPNAFKLTIELTSRCPYKCSYCISSIPNRSERYDLHIDEIKKSIDFFKSFGSYKKVILTGGEPLLRNDLNEVIELFLENNYDEILILSNLYKKENDLKNVVENISDPSKVSFVSTYHKFQTSFEEYVKKLDILLNYGIKYIWKYIYEYSEFNTIVKILNNFNINASQHMKNLYISRERFDTKSLLTMSRIRTSEFSYLIKNDMHFGIVENDVYKNLGFDDFMTEYPNKINMSDYICDFSRAATIEANGRVGFPICTESNICRNVYVFDSIDGVKDLSTIIPIQCNHCKCVNECLLSIPKYLKK